MKDISSRPAMLPLRVSPLGLPPEVGTCMCYLVTIPYTRFSASLPKRIRCTTNSFLHFRFGGEDGEDDDEDEEDDDDDTPAPKGKSGSKGKPGEQPAECKQQ